jgi:hypothetical protein
MHRRNHAVGRARTASMPASPESGDWGTDTPAKQTGFEQDAVIVSPNGGILLANSEEP